MAAGLHWLPLGIISFLLLHDKQVSEPLITRTIRTTVQFILRMIHQTRNSDRGRLYLLIKFNPFQRAISRYNFSAHCFKMPQTKYLKLTNVHNAS